jgi:hypothetical protein
VKHQAKHFFYAVGWKKFEAAWNMVIRARQLRRMTPLLEAVLSKVTRARERVAPPRPAGGLGLLARSGGLIHCERRPEQEEPSCATSPPS